MNTFEAYTHGIPPYSCDVCKDGPPAVAANEEVEDEDVEAHNTESYDEGVDVAFEEEDDEAFPQYFLQRISDQEEDEDVDEAPEHIVRQ